MKPLAIICDIDGTLAHRVDRGPFDWKKVESDTQDFPVGYALEVFNRDGLKVILVSGRDEVCRVETERWLNKYGIQYEELFMRPEGNNEDDRIIKQRIYESQIKEKYQVVFVLDDRNKVVKMWRELGLKCFQVAEGDF